ncbi:hypothetical protein AMELA_G00175230 [Ameiurus melas]|uniref:Uncharacterized protein n=1 Tax=Ameiurus melas TaxID=219545 RepID=A0A7J6AD66_AMEME|nr:hypothetical protein AMELA_G00175230 [Ameiurus melas]
MSVDQCPVFTLLPKHYNGRHARKKPSQDYSLPMSTQAKIRPFMDQKQRFRRSRGGNVMVWGCFTASAGLDWTGLDSLHSLIELKCLQHIKECLKII